MNHPLPRSLLLVGLLLFFDAAAFAQSSTFTDPHPTNRSEDKDARSGRGNPLDWMGNGLNAMAQHRPVTVRGVIQCEDGMPIEYTVIVSTAGGQAISDSDGSFTLTVDVPIDAESLGVMIVATIDSVNYTANRLVDLSPTARHRDLGEIALESGTECELAWIPTFGEKPGCNDTVSTLLVFDDGSGPALYVGGRFTTAGGVQANHIAKWNGSSWSPVGSGMNWYVSALTVFDDGSGPALHAGGGFTTAGGVEANRIAKWDGSSWSPLGSGMDSIVTSLTVFDDGSGSGPALYAGGVFTTAGGMNANRIAKWDGSSWSALGSGMSGGGEFPFVSALTVFDDGSGLALYAGGEFTTAGGVEANHIARWDGSSWSSLGSGMAGGIPSVRSLTVFDDGSGGGPALYAGGWFESAGGVSASFIARWDGSSWSSLGSGMNGAVVDLMVFDNGSGAGPALYAGGWFSTAGGVAARSIAKWNGSSWSPLGSGLSADSNPSVFAITVFDDGSGDGPALYAGGRFTTAGEVSADRIARWHGSSWSSLGSGMNDAVTALTVFDDGLGSGPALYTGGLFTSAGGETVNRIARWDGSSWSPLGTGVNERVHALTVFDDGSGSGPTLYAGGYFTTAGGAPASRIAKWDGSTWSPLGNGLNIGGQVLALAVFDDGSGTGPALYVGGFFTSAGGETVNHIAKWDGSSWSPLGSGMSGWVRDLLVFDDGSGSGPALYAGGNFFTAGDVTVNHIARWDGSSWSPLGSGMDGLVFALTVFDDSSGPAMYVGGNFTTAGGVSANRIAKWDGSTWSPLGSGMNCCGVTALTVFDDGSGAGPTLYAGGSFTSAGGVTANNIAKWDGSVWSPLVSGTGGPNPSVLALAVFDDSSGYGPALYAGGTFIVSPRADSYLAKWQGCPIEPDCAPADLNCDGVVNVADLLILFNNWGACDDCTDCPADLNDDCVVNVGDLLIMFNNWG